MRSKIDMVGAFLHNFSPIQNYFCENDGKICAFAYSLLLATPSNADIWVRTLSDLLFMSIFSLALLMLRPACQSPGASFLDDSSSALQSNPFANAIKYATKHRMTWFFKNIIHTRPCLVFDAFFSLFVSFVSHYFFLCRQSVTIVPSYINSIQFDRNEYANCTMQVKLNHRREWCRLVPGAFTNLLQFESSHRIH